MAREVVRSSKRLLLLMQICKRTFIVLLLFLFLGNDYAFGQDSTHHNSIQKKKLYKSLSVPISLIGAGLLVKQGSHSLNDAIRNKRNKDFPSFHTHGDDYLQYLPIAAVYGLELAGVKGENNFGNSMALIIKSEILMTIMVQPLKKYTYVMRPDSSSFNSLPSGHTAQAFVAATFLHKEFGKKNIWYSIGAYTCATAVGTMRMLNNRHWFSDVLVGAGIGILSTNLVYYTHRYTWSKKKGGTVVMPTYGSGPGLYVCYSLR
jgi:hypothetical protein